MAKAKVTRTFGPIHFEDMDPHRFEDLIRELIYDFRDWQSIEATGRSGSDDGFDIRAYEKIEASVATVDEGEEIEVRHPMEGNQWMIQGKREKEIGPAKLKKILEEVDAQAPPYGYILAASANFSKASYDLFRTKLREKGVMEFYLWGKSELEDMLHLPKNDRILFTFTGISLVSKRKSRAAELRFSVVNKNKLFRIFGDEVSGHQSVLLRDSKDDKYPYADEYQDFKERPRWKEYIAEDYHPLGLVVRTHRYFAYIDPSKKQFDFSPTVTMIHRESDSDEQRKEQSEAREKVEDFWDHLPNRHKAMFCRNGLVRYDEMLVIDDKGDTWHKFPHIFVDFEGPSGPFAGSFEYAEVDRRAYGASTTYGLRNYERIKIFPEVFPERKVGKVHKDASISFDEQTLKMYTHGNDKGNVFYDADGKYDFLQQRDVIGIAESEEGGRSPYYMQITHKRRVKLKDLLKEEGDHAEYLKDEIERRVGRTIRPNEALIVFEFKRTYEREFDPKRRL